MAIKRKRDVLIGEIIQPTVVANCVRPQAFAERPTNKIICRKKDDPRQIVGGHFILFNNQEFSEKTD